MAMQRIEFKPIIPKIDPVNDDNNRPFWSVMIPTYNCAQYLEKTLKSVLDQDPGASEMQIEIVDDCSTMDDPEKVVREVGKGRIDFHRNHSNLGPTRNFNNCLRRSKGRYIHILHGDDYVEGGFYSTIRNMIQNEPSFGLYGTRSFVMDANGILEWISPKFAELKPKGHTTLPFAQSNHLYFPAMVINRYSVEISGGFDEGFGHVADWEMWVRLMFYHGGLMSNIPKAYYRWFDQNDSTRHRKNGNNLIEQYKVHFRFRQLMPQLDNEEFMQNLRENAYSQFLDYHKKGEKIAANSNFLVWKQFTPFRSRIIKHIKYFGKMLLG